MDKEEIENRDMIVTFSCAPDIYIYTEKSLVKPRLPYKTHPNIKDAKKRKPNGNIIYK